MNYSKSIKKTAIGKRILISWLIVAAVFLLIGGLIGLGISARANKDSTEAPEISENPETSETKILIYGQYDGRIFEGEMSQDWGGELEFTPLDIPLNEDIQEFAFYLSAAYNIDYSLVIAMIEYESSFQADAVSKTNDYGLMQINAINHEYLKETLGVTDFLDPYQNIKSGLFILRKLFEKYETPEKVLMAYNMGEAGAARLWEQGIFETNHSRNIMRLQERYTLD